MGYPVKFSIYHISDNVSVSQAPTCDCVAVNWSLCLNSQLPAVLPSFLGGSASCLPAAKLWHKVLHLPAALPDTATKLSALGANLSFLESCSDGHRPGSLLLSAVLCFHMHSSPFTAQTSVSSLDNNSHKGRACILFHSLFSASGSVPGLHTFPSRNT